MPIVRFIQFSDLHLGAPFQSLPADRREQRRADQRRAFEAVVTAAIEREAAAILVPGDLFDAEGVDARTLSFAVHAFDRDGCPPVFIAPGNHDPATAKSPAWNARLLAARGWAWPAHVRVFDEASWTPAGLHAHAVTIWGRCYTSSAPGFERPLDRAMLPPATALDESRAHIALFHGSDEGRCPPGQKITAPFSAAEALASPFAYLAVGHYHRPSTIEANGSVRLAYAGSTVALDPAEAGVHGALEVRLDVATRRVEIEPLPLDDRRTFDLAVDVTGAASADAIDYRISEALAAAGATERDIARVRLTGRIVRGVRYAAPGRDVQPQVFALRLDPGALRPDYDLEGIRAREPAATEDRFAHALFAQLDAATDPAERARILAALYYGLDAFRLREVTPGWEAIADAQEAEA